MTGVERSRCGTWRVTRWMGTGTVAVITLLASGLVSVVSDVSPLAAQQRRAGSGAFAPPQRTIRRDIPLPTGVKRALMQGTRDSSGAPGRNYWQLRVDYTIRARIDTTTSVLSGSERVLVHNASPDSLTAIALRLDANIFRGPAPHAAPWMIAEVTDGVMVTRLLVNGQEVELQNPTSTLATIPLPRAAQPGERVTLDIDWHHKLPGGPGVGHRMTQRWADSLYQPTQWYPRVAMYDDLRGWDRELYLGPSEFFNSFGRFDVTIDAPAGWLVSGTGVLQNPNDVLTATARERLARALESDDITTIVSAEERGAGVATAEGDGSGWLTWHFVADSVNDFAWATARSFVWKTTRATIPTRGVVPVHMLHLPGRANLYARAGEITRHALEFYSALWFPYPFPQLTLQDGPSAGMEYPMVINSNQGAADHEAAHQWWPMVVATNETWYGWMDEGFNQYMNILSAADAAGRAPVLDGLGQSYGRTVGNEAEPVMMWNANYAGPQFYGFTTYQKAPLMLSMLGGIVGDSAVQRAQREWAMAWRFKHPSPWDWMFFMNRALGQDLGWFWNGWLFSNSSVDGRIATVEVNRGRTRVTVVQDGEMPSPVVLEVKFVPGSEPIRLPSNAVQRDSVTAVVTYPVDVWFSGDRTFVADVAFGTRRIEAITLDPACRFPDRNPRDNYWVAAPVTPSSLATVCPGRAS